MAVLPYEGASEETYNLPLPLPDGNVRELEVERTTIIVGANGAGKTRLGAWIESYLTIKSRAHRISAQKTLGFSEHIQIVQTEQAYKELLYGAGRQNASVDIREGHRWGGSPATHHLNDYDKLLSLIFSEELEQSTIYRQKLRNHCEATVPETKFDTIKKVWEELIPHRELTFNKLRLETNVRGSTKEYAARDMSDGERVAFYLIGQCLAAPGKGLIIVDEPELHLHNSIRSRLWQSIQSVRPDCQFLFLTHDLEFAASIDDATKIVVSSYDGSKWDWKKLDSQAYVPEDVHLELLGTRKNILFVEGTRGSDDISLYCKLFPSAKIIPLGSCKSVIDAVRGFHTNEHLHHLKVFGLIDRDRRTEHEVADLENIGLFVLSVAELEHLYCVPEVIAIFAKRVLQNVDETQTKVSSFLIRKFEDEFEQQIALHVSDEIKNLLAKVDIGNCKSKSSLIENVGNTISSIDVGCLYESRKAEFQKIVDTRNQRELLSIYNRKSLSSTVCSELGLKNGELRDFVFRGLGSECQDELRSALHLYFPERLTSALSGA